MRLTLVNMKNILRKKLIPFRFRGKHRIVKPVELPALRKRYEELMRQEQNMLILRHPYLTVEQSRGSAVPKTKGSVFIKELWNQKRNEKFNKTYTWAEQLSHLRVKDAWD